VVGGGVGAPPSRKPLRRAAAAALGGFLFGYEAAVISGALLFIRQDFALGDLEQGAIVSVLPLGAMLGGLLAGSLADALGRRRTLILDAVVFVAGTLLAVTAGGYGVLLVARGITGLGVGIASSTVPLYLSEVAPAGVRGRLVLANQVMVTSGIVAAYCVDLLFAHAGAWRAMFAVALLPAAALAVGMLRAPESPLWLEAHARSGSGKQATEQAVGGLRVLLGPAARPATIVAVTLAAAQQFAGINAIISYAPSIMEKTGLGLSSSILYSVAIGAVNVLATVVAFRLVDRAGRRPLLLISLGGMLISLVMLGLIFEVPLGSASSWLALACLLVYVAAFAIGLGPIFWLLMAEVFPHAARSAGASVATAVNWLSGVLVALGFLAVAAAVGEGPTFWIFAAVCALTFLFAKRYVPETKERSFSEIEADVRERWGTRRP
jgi:MFS family permease